MNVCAARMLLDGTSVHWITGDVQTVDKAGWTVLEHEPVSWADRYALSLINDKTQSAETLVGDFAECRHCGAVFRTEEGQ